MYKILGADQREYGPVGAGEIRQWFAEGRVNAQTPVQAAGSAEWRPLGTFTEFAFLAAPAPFATLPMGSGSSAKTNGFALTGFILGVVNLASVFSILCCLAGPPCAILGLVFSIMGIAQINKNPIQGGKGLAIAGIILCVLGLLLFGILLIVGAIGSALQDVSGS